MIFNCLDIVLILNNPCRKRILEMNHSPTAIRGVKSALSLSLSLSNLSITETLANWERMHACMQERADNTWLRVQHEQQFEKTQLVGFTGSADCFSFPAC